MKCWNCSENCPYFLKKSQFQYSFIIQYFNTRGVFSAESQFYILKLLCFCQLKKKEKKIQKPKSILIFFQINQLPSFLNTRYSAYLQTCKLQTSVFHRSFYKVQYIGLQ